MKLKVNTIDFRRQCATFARQINQTSREVLRVEMALWGEDLAKRTGFVKRGTIGRDGSAPTMARAITNDLRRAFQVVPSLVRARRGAFQAASTHYQQARSPITGRPGKQYGKGGSGNRPVIDERTMLRLARAAFRHVGTVRAGWIPMIRHFGGKMPVSWIARQESRATGRGSDTFTADGKGVGRGVNSVAWASRMCPRRLVLFTASVRQKHLRRLLKMEVGKAVTQFNRIRAKRVAV